ncbi:MAG TPA: YDG domain-containing protein [Verrucomicrobiae bacterium]|nr:YDG domain-containing protein [Verrucomicrobiae bacterium]
MLIKTTAANTTISSIPNRTIAKNTSAGPITFTISDPALPPSGVVVTGTSDNTTLLPNANIHLDGDTLTRMVTLTPAADQLGTANVTLTAVGTTTATTTFQLRVLDPAADALPVIAPISNPPHTLPGIPVGPIQLTISDAETPQNDLILTGTSSNHSLVSDANIVFYNKAPFTFVGVVPTDSETGSATITVTVSDGLRSASQNFTVVVDALPVRTAQFANFSSILIGPSGAASAYPSTLPVSGLPGTVTDVTITLYGLSHPVPKNLDMVLVAPSGQYARIQSGGGLDKSITHVSYALSDSAPFTLPGSSEIIVGKYKPTDFNSGDVMAPPAPAGPYLSAMSTFHGADPNGDWQLYIYNQGAPQGALEGGWALTITTIAPPVISAIADVITPQDTSTGPLPFTVTDADTPPENILVTATSSNQGLIPDGNIHIVGPPNRTVTVDPVIGQTGTALITINATDGVSADTEDFLVTVGLTELTITIDDASRVYGDGNPTFHAEITGVTPGDNITLGTVLSPATTTSPVGTYVIAASLVDPDNKLGHYIVHTNGGTLGVAKRTLTISATGQNKIYDGTTVATVTLQDDRVNGDALTIAPGPAAFLTKDAANNKTVNVTGITLTGAASGNYNFNTTASTTANIAKRTLAVSASGENKVYDGNTTANVTLSDDRVLGDTLTTTFTTGTFGDKHVGTAKPISVTGISISGTDAGNYNFNTSTTASADITKRALTVTAAGQNKVYDGITAATVTFGDDRLTGDSFVATGTATFADKTAANGKTVSVTGITLSGGTESGDYLPNPTASTTADITKRPLTVSATGVDRAYDGTTAASVTLSDNRVAGDVFSDTFASAAFADKHAGNNKPVSVNGVSITGADAGNYTFNTTATATANVSPRGLTAVAQGVDKVYDGTTAAPVTFTDNRLLGDVFDVVGSATFATKIVEAGKAVTVSGISLTGTDALDYTVNTSSSTTASITQRGLVVTASGVDKAYDGTTTATVTLSDNRVALDVLTTTYASAVFDDPAIGTDKHITVTGINVTGPDAPNYSFNTTASATAEITEMTLVITPTGVNKVYDGTTTATVVLSDNRQTGDDITVNYTTALFADKHVGTAKEITVTGITVTGPDAGHYTFNETATASADITVHTLTVTANGISKTYDGNTAANVTLSDNRVSGDAITVAFGAAAFNNKNVDTAKPVSVTGISVSGTDAGDYTHNTTASATANITPRSLIVSATGVSKVYDGTTTASVNLSDNRVSGDSLTLTFGAANFDNKNVGEHKTVSVTGIGVSGGDADNYTFNAAATTTANITSRVLLVSASGVNKVYDGTTAATVTLSDNRVSGDTLTATYASATFADKLIGTAKPISVTDIAISGPDSGDYTFNSTASATADITQRALLITATGIGKTYDGTTAATVTLSDDRISGDSLTVTEANSFFNDQHVGTAKTVLVTGLSVSGTDADNYLPPAFVTTTADVTPAPLAVKAEDKSAYYGDPLPPLTLVYTGFIGGDGPSSLPTEPTATTTATSTSPLGPYPITAAGGVGGDYAFSYAGGTLTLISHPPSLKLLGVSGTGVQLNVTAAPGQPLVVEFTDDLSTGSWTVLSSLENATGTNDITDADAVGHPFRFYRARFGP